ncbi:MAG: M20/M25/M40 family metallo-hydrolase [Clostridiaceae bacterium]|jgi:hypothetical protein|nr:M20/M25/M40 family metallo-hydrolase [Clostridiaceae bacterium]
MDYKKHADDAMDFIRRLEADGCRFPGSPEEKVACEKIQAEIKETGLEPRTEEFIYAPNAGIGIINKLGWAALIFTGVYYISVSAALVALLGFVGILVFALTQIIRYTGMWDFVFKQEKAKNIISEVQPQSGKTDYSIFLGAHYDSSWCWKLAVKNPNTAILKTAYGVVGIVVLIGLSILKITFGYATFPISADAYHAVNLITLILPLVFIPGMFFVTQFTSQDKTIGSPGAMDNLTGIGINIQLMKYFNEHPEALPENCRLVNVGFASEEAGLKGAKAYVAKHKSDPDFKNCYVINIDSIADPEHFEAVKGDPWQGSHFDENMISLTLDAMRESGIASPKTIVNPIGGCDSTPFSNEGVPTLTIAAQDPRSTTYYHTCNDKSERFSVDTVATGLEVVYRLIQKIGAQRGGRQEVQPNIQPNVQLDDEHPDEQ